MKIKSKIEIDDNVIETGRIFDYVLNDEIITNIPDFELPEKFNIGLIVGGSGTGKTTILKKHCKLFYPEWDKQKAIISHFESFEDGREKLGAVGLNSIPTWIRPFNTLSNGEQFRANLARMIQNGIAIDEFTSVVDRNVAKSCAVSLSKYINRKGLEKIVLSSCHYDIIEWLQPDWIFDCNIGQFWERGRLRPRPKIEITMEPSTSEAWSFFSKYHYLSAKINRASRCWTVWWENILVAFTSVLPMPVGTIKNAWRGHRTVVLPEYQGLGIGSAISDAVGEMFLSIGCRYFSKTSHPNFGLYREFSDK